MIFSYSDVTMIPCFDQKDEKSFATYLYPHLTLPLDRMMSQSFLHYLNLMQGNLSLFQMNRVWNGLCC